MALMKTMIDSKGQSVSYHRILAASVVFVKDQEMIHVNLGGYTNETYRETEKESANVNMVVSNTAVQLPLSETEDFSRSALYTRIKAEIPAFAEAQDI